MQGLIEAQNWTDDRDLAQAYINWSSYAYGRDSQGRSAPEAFQARLQHMQVVLHNQDNREHDLLDSDDYYQFEGGLAAAVRHLSGAAPAVYHNDHSRPETPKVRTLEEEIGRVVRARVVNPKWIAGVMRHGYKGAFEMAATVDYMFAFAATTGAVADHHFDAVYDAYIEDDQVRQFLMDNNPNAAREMAERGRGARTHGRGDRHGHDGRLQVGQVLAALGGALDEEDDLLLAGRHMHVQPDGAVDGALGDGVALEVAVLGVAEGALGPAEAAGAGGELVDALAELDEWAQDWGEEVPDGPNPRLRGD